MMDPCNGNLRDNPNKFCNEGPLCTVAKLHGGCSDCRALPSTRQHRSVTQQDVDETRFSSTAAAHEPERN